VVVVGGGKIAERRIGTLRAMGARITLVSPRLTPALKALAHGNTIRWIPRPYEKGDLSGALLGFAATDDPEVNRRVAEEADSINILVNVATDPEGSSFHLPSFFSRGAIQIAVSTDGRSPVLAAWLRRRLSLEVDAAYALLAEVLGEVRRKLRASGVDSAERAKLLSALVDSDLVELIRDALRSAPRDWGRVKARVGGLCGGIQLRGRWEAFDSFQAENDPIEEGDGFEE
jgi:precorrin-2 dehydrogenase/sirohydrochlorin ferrochelatase